MNIGIKINGETAEGFPQARYLGLLAGVALGFTFASGCIGGIKRDLIVKAPDSPMLIHKVDGRVLRVSIYDKESNQMVAFPESIHVNGQLEGFTLSKFDWEKFINEHQD